MKLTLTKRWPEAPGIETFLFRPETKLSFIPGQYLRWTLPHQQPDSRGIWRFFSVASSPEEASIQLTTKFAPEHGSSFKAALRKLQTGDYIEATGPIGRFILNEDARQYPILVAGGIGITPYRSMIAHMHLSGQYRPFHLIYACRTATDAVFKPLFSDVSQAFDKANISYVFEADSSQPPQNVTLGRLTGQKIYELEPNAKNGAIYLSGPQPMVEGLKDQLLELGHPTELIKTDFFPGYKEI
jgi:glycine betaine catabolism B